MSEARVRELLGIEEVIEAVEQAFRDLAAGRAVNLTRRRVRAGGAMLHLMGAASQAMNLLVYKAYSTSAQGAWFHVRAYRADRGVPVADIEADWLGRLRTGAASAVSVRYLARPDSRVLAVLGCGKQAETQILAIAAVRPLEAITVYCRTPERRQRFADYMASTYHLPVQASPSAHAAVADADIIVTITTSNRPVIQADWIKPGAHICAAGSNSLQRRELDEDTVRAASLIAIDSVEQARIEAGDLAEPVAKGLLDWSDLVPLEQIVAGNHPGRQDDRQITIFESLGIGLEDLAAVYALLKRLAVELAIWEQGT